MTVPFPSPLLRLALVEALHGIEEDVAALEAMLKIDAGAEALAWMTRTSHAMKELNARGVWSMPFEARERMIIYLGRAAAGAAQARRLLGTGYFDEALYSALEGQRDIARAAGAALGLELSRERDRNVKAGKNRHKAKHKFQMETYQNWLEWQRLPEPERKKRHTSRAAFARAMYENQESGLPHNASDARHL